MINRGSQRNEGNFTGTTVFCKTLPNDIKEADIYYDLSYKLQCSITPQYQPTIDATMEGLCNLQDVKQLLPIEDHWEISKMWSMDQELVVAQEMVSDHAT